MDIHELRQFESVYKPSKEVAFCWLRKQYVQLSTEENHTEIVDHANDSLRIWQAAKAQAVPEGFVEKTESNTRHYFKLKDWDEWTCIDGLKDAITSDHDINAIVEVECLEVIEINNKPCFALLAFGKRHGTEVKFFDTEEEAIEAQEPTND